MRTVSLPNNVLIPQIKRVIDEGHTATFRVRGFSMRIFLEDRRDKVVLAPCREVRKGDVVLAEVQPEFYVLHRVIRKDGNRLTLMGDGNIKGTEECLTENVIGVATGFIRKGRTRIDSTDGMKWKTYSWLWLRLQPLRRYILAFYRRIWLKLFPVNITE